MRKVVIVGGGFSGASAAVQLARKVGAPLAITIVEPRDEIGPGLAYDTDDPVFRLNAVAGAHSIDVADPGHFLGWYEAQGLAEEDPAAIAPCGQPFALRRDYGRYLAETVRDHSAMPNGTRIEHRKTRVESIVLGDSAVLRLEDGARIEADQVILATGNPAPRRPAILAGDLARHPAIRANPLIEGVEDIPADAHVLVLGAGLTALDMVAKLVEAGHSGPITAISRRGLRPRPQPPAILSPPPDPPQPPVIPLDLLEGELPPYAERVALTAVGLLRGLRAHVREVEAMGEPWQSAFDALAMPLSRIWPHLPLAEKQRVLRHLRPFYDAFRFRTPPMTEAIVRKAEGSGQVNFLKATQVSLKGTEDGGLEAQLRLPGGKIETQKFGAFVNCSGLDTAGAIEGNPLLAALVDQGHLLPHPTGLGFVTDMECRAVDASGEANSRLRILGPPTAGMFGDPLGAFFISAQIHRIIPGLAQELER